jgi:prepilin-type processing-associated H-X9-DG protein
MKKQAFTLVELLVIVAIIAVLAAVLFPVFSASRPARQITSMNHANLIANGEALYSQDYDNYFVLVSQDSADMTCPSGIYCLHGYPFPALNWPILLLPYMGGSLGDFIYPATGDPQGIFGKHKNAIVQNWNLNAQYGYNYQFLSPVGFANNGQITFPTLGRSYSAAIHPAQTVMFATAQSWALPGNGSAQFDTPDFDFAQPPGTLEPLYYASDRVEFVGESSTPPLWQNNWIKNTPIGEITGDVRCLKPAAQATVAWVDGHVTNMTAIQLAAGTDFTTATTAEDNGFGTEITNVSQYLWTLDGTLDDIQ